MPPALPGSGSRFSGIGNASLILGLLGTLLLFTEFLAAAVIMQTRGVELVYSARRAFNVCTLVSYLSLLVGFCLGFIATVGQRVTRFTAVAGLAINGSMIFAVTILFIIARYYIPH